MRRACDRKEFTRLSPSLCAPHVALCSRVHNLCLCSADGDTALILAAWYGHTDITRLLLDSRADVDATNCDGNCALNCAAYHGFMEVAALLVDGNATIDVRDNVTGKTALIKAAYVGHTDVAEVLLRAGADRNAMDNQGYSALAFSTSFNHIGVLDVLLRANADPNVQDEVRVQPATCPRNDGRDGCDDLPRTHVPAPATMSALHRSLDPSRRSALRSLLLPRRMFPAVS